MNKDINIKYMTESAYATLYSNPNTFSKLIQDNGLNNNWLGKVIGKNCFEERIYRIKDFDLKLSPSGKYIDVEFENAIILYEALKTLPRYVLFDERFWAWITFSKCYKVSVQSMQVKSKNTFKSNWLLTNKMKRDKIFRNVLTRSYFLTDLTNTNDGNYDLTKFVFEKYERIKYLFYDNKSKYVILNILKAEKEIYDKYSNNKEYKTIFKKYENLIYNYISKYMSLYGSVRDLDLLSSSELFNITYKELERVIKEIYNGNIDVLNK